MVVDMTDKTLAKVSSNGDVSIVDFWAPWCKPCLEMMPTFEALSNEIDGAVFYKVNVQDSAQIAMAYGVQSVPTIVVMKGSKPVGTIIGAFSKSTLKEKIEGLLRRV